MKHTILLLFSSLLLFFACTKELITPDPNPGPDPNCAEQNTIFAPDNKPANVAGNIAFQGTIMGFQMINADTGYLFGGNPNGFQAVLLKTTNGGKTFGPSNLQIHNQPVSFAFKDKDNGIVSVQDHTNLTIVSLTRDGGESWVSKTIPNLQGSLNGLKFDEDGRLYAMLISGTTAAIVVSEDEGDSWDTLFASPDIDPFNVDFRFLVSGNDLYVAGINKNIFVLNKQGSLQRTISNPLGFGYAFQMPDEQNMIVVGYEGAYSSTNGGNSWKMLSDKPSRLLACESPQKILTIQQKSNCNSDFVFSQDIIARTTDGGANWQTADLATTNLRFWHFGSQRIGPGKYLFIFGRQLIAMNL